MAHSRARSVAALATLLIVPLAGGFLPGSHAAVPDPNPWPQGDPVMDEVKAWALAMNGTLAPFANQTATYKDAFASLHAAERLLNAGNAMDVMDRLIAAEVKVQWVVHRAAATAAEENASGSGHRDSIIAASQALYLDSENRSRANRAALADAFDGLRSRSGLDHLLFAAHVHTIGRDYVEGFPDRVSEFQGRTYTYQANHPSYLIEAEKLVRVPIGSLYLESFAARLIAVALAADADAAVADLDRDVLDDVVANVNRTIRQSPSSAPLLDARYLSRGRAAFNDGVEAVGLAEFARYRDANAIAGSRQQNEANDPKVRARLVSEYANVTARLYGIALREAGNLTTAGFPLAFVRDDLGRAAHALRSSEYGTLTENHARLTGILTRLAILTDSSEEPASTPVTPGTNPVPAGTPAAEGGNRMLVAGLLMVTLAAFGGAWWILRK